MTNSKFYNNNAQWKNAASKYTGAAYNYRTRSLPPTSATEPISYFKLYKFVVIISRVVVESDQPSCACVLCGVGVRGRIFVV